MTTLFLTIRYRKRSFSTLRMFMANSSAKDPDGQMRRVAAVLRALEVQAGISDQCARAYEVFPWNVNSDVPFGSKAAAEERLQDNISGRRQVVDRVRRVYFAVPDLETRKALISGSRAVDKLRHESAQASVQIAEIGLASAISRSPTMAIRYIPALMTSAICWGVYYNYGSGAALAALAFGLAEGRWIATTWLVDRDRAVREAEAHLQLIRSLAEDSYQMAFTFSRLEEATGVESMVN